MLSPRSEPNRSRRCRPSLNGNRIAAHSRLRQAKRGNRISRQKTRKPPVLNAFGTAPADKVRNVVVDFEGESVSEASFGDLFIHASCGQNAQTEASLHRRHL